MKIIKLFSIPLILFPILLQAQVTYIAHRGASHLAPENTSAAINLAWELGSKAAECDVLLTKDKKIVVFHDKNTIRLCGKSCNIRKKNYKDLKNLPVRLNSNNLPQYRGETIPLLQDILQTVPDSTTLVIEIKCGSEILNPMKEILGKHWKSGKIVFIAFDYETIMTMKKAFPKVPCYFLAHLKGNISKHFDELIKGPLDGVDLNHGIVSRKLVNRFKKHGKTTWCYTVNGIKEALRMKACGVTGITTNRPKWLKEQVLRK